MENGKRERKNEEKKKQKAKRQGCPSGTMRVLGSQRGGCIMSIMAIPRRQSVGQTACSPLPLRHLGPR